MTLTEARAALQVVAWRRVAGLSRAGDLIEAAVDALVAGLDGPALCEVAGLNARDSREEADLLEPVIREQQLDLVDVQTALWQLVKLTAQQVVDGELDPIIGAEQIWTDAYQRLEHNGDLRIFVGLASEFDDHPEGHDLLAPEVIRAAAELLERPRPRRWLRLQASMSPPWTLATASGHLELDLRGLALPEDLLDELDGWRQGWDGLFDRASGDGGFVSLTDAEAFVSRGRELADRLSDALGSTWHVEYYPEPIRPPGVRLRPRASGWTLLRTWAGRWKH